MPIPLIAQEFIQNLMPMETAQIIERALIGEPKPQPKVQRPQIEIDENTKNELLYTTWGEAANQPTSGVKAVFSTMFNRYKQSKDWGKTLKGYSAYTTKSPQYRRAKEGKLNAFENRIYRRNKQILEDLISGKEQPIPRITHFENLYRFPEPSWAKEKEKVGQYGVQTFYAPKEK